jgi:hypothetical protein
MEATSLINTKRPSQSSDSKACSLTLVTTTLRVSQADIAAQQPQKIAQTSYSFRFLFRPFTSVLPYTYTWTDTAVFVSLSDSILRLYKIPLTTTLPHGPEESLITSPRNIIFLPRSAHNRTVQFFPPRRPGYDSKIIIGPRYGSAHTPPIAMYLNDEDLGSWEDSQLNDDRTGLKDIRSHDIDDVEQWDPDDCDIEHLDMDK